MRGVGIDAHNLPSIDRSRVAVTSAPHQDRTSEIRRPWAKYGARGRLRSLEITRGTAC